MSRPPAKLAPVVGIGSSAGGLEAMLQMLPRLRPNGRTRFVVAQHLLKSDHSDLVLRVLGRKSSLPVVEARDNDVVEPDRLYLIPSNWNGVLKDGRLRLQAPVQGQLSVPSVNVLFESIAADAGASSIGVVLSGAGSDGVVGCKAIKARGGKILIQTPETALINGMPGAVARASLVDESLSPEALADHINDLVSAAVVPSGALPSGTVQPVSAPSEGSPELASLIRETSRASGIDFSSYKEDTLLRRIQGRMKALGADRLQDYGSYVQRNPGELEILRQLFVVSLSWFFRDRAAFNKLRQCLLEYLALKPIGDCFRVWVPGCATGEECFSLAILLTDLFAERGLRARIEVLGSDLNVEALSVARAAQYPAKAFKELPEPDVIARHFVAESGGYRVADHIRAACVFREEDVITTKPPAPLDMVSCRNLLIYMKSELQLTMISKFFEALKPEALLFLGLSENVGVSGAASFTAIDSSLRIFRRKSIGGASSRG